MDLYQFFDDAICDLTAWHYTEGWGFARGEQLLAGLCGGTRERRSRPDRLDPGIHRLTHRHPRPYLWTATAEPVVAKVARGRIALENVS